MIEKMTKYSFILPAGEGEGFLETLAGLGVMDITRSFKPVDERSEGMLADAAALKDRIATLEKDGYSSDSEYAAILQEKEIASKALRERSEWGEFNSSDIEGLAENGVTVKLYEVPEKKFDPAWEENCVLEEISREGGKVRFAAAFPSGTESPVPFKETPLPRKSIETFNVELAEIDAKLRERELEIDEERKTLPEMKKKYGKILSDLDLYLAGVAKESAAEGHLELFTGFAPTEGDAELQEKLDEKGYFYLSESATAEDNPPIKLRNNAFARNFESLTGMYGMPVYDEMDPTPILAPFFLLFFSMCMGDAGYGLLLIAVAFLFKNGVNILGLGNHWRLIMMLGVGTTIVGFFLGTFFGISLPDAAWVPQGAKDLMITGEIAGFNAQMVLALAIGVFHICLAMVVKAIIFTRRFGLGETISTWGWVVLIVGGLTVGGFSLAGVLSARATKIAIIAVGVVSALAIFIFNKPGRNPLINVGAGLWDTYGMVTGLAGDVLSYIRIFALGLAGGMLGSAFNSLASMTLGSDPTWQWIIFALIALVGHALNFAMCCLGAFVHPLRLNFLEFFKNSGYEGKGTKYSPITNNN